VVGWYQGRLEFDPSLLGNRPILTDLGDTTCRTS
jgi:predicted NodU family carbamoyl transferase